MVYKILSSFLELDSEWLIGITKCASGIGITTCLFVGSISGNCPAVKIIKLSASKVARIKLYMTNEIRGFLDWKASYATRASINYATYLRKFAEMFPNKTISEITVHDIVKYQKIMSERYAPSSVFFAMVVLKNFLRWLQDCGHKVVAPGLVKVPRFIPKSHRPIRKVYFDQLVNTIPDDDFWSLRDKTILWLLWDTGMRISEVLDLDVNQIDMDRMGAVINTKKNGCKRQIFWSIETQRLLQKYYGIRRELRSPNEALFVGKDPSGRITMRLTTRTFQRHMKMYLNYAGIQEKLTPHSFRHGWAVRRRELGAQLPFIQKALGHSNPLSTFVYQQYSDNGFEKEAKKYLDPVDNLVDNLT
jgi:integrase/recombinase XerD